MVHVLNINLHLFQSDFAIAEATTSADGEIHCGRSALAYLFQNFIILIHLVSDNIMKIVSDGQPRDGPNNPSQIGMSGKMLSNRWAVLCHDRELNGCH